MNHDETTYYRAEHSLVRRIRMSGARLIGLLIVVGAVATALINQLPTSEVTSPAESSADRHRGAIARDSTRSSGLGEAAGAVPSGTTVFDDAVPGVAKLDDALLAALRRAATDASGEGVTFRVDSGWRSAEYQQHLLDEAVAKYGSQAEASRWVATPGKSAHVSGDAIDIGPSSAAAWLREFGSAYGLCQIYANEAWHYELRPEAINHGCPAPYADPTRDPRMQ